MLMEFLEKANKEGLPVPLAYDNTSKGPSITMFFTYLSNLLAIVSLALLHVKGDPTTATITTCIFAVVQTVLYMFRRLQKAKFDFDDKEIELEGEDDAETNN